MQDKLTEYKKGSAELKLSQQWKVEVYSILKCWHGVEVVYMQDIKYLLNYCIYFGPDIGYGKFPWNIVNTTLFYTVSTARESLIAIQWESHTGFQMYSIDIDNIWYFESVLKIVRIHSSQMIILILSMMPKLTTTNILTYGSLHKPLAPGIKYRSKKIHNSIKYTQSSSCVRCLDGK